MDKSIRIVVDVTNSSQIDKLVEKLRSFNATLISVFDNSTIRDQTSSIITLQRQIDELKNTLSYQKEKTFFDYLGEAITSALAIYGTLTASFEVFIHNSRLRFLNNLKQLGPSILLAFRSIGPTLLTALGGIALTIGTWLVGLPAAIGPILASIVIIAVTGLAALAATALAAALANALIWVFGGDNFIDIPKLLLDLISIPIDALGSLGSYLSDFFFGTGEAATTAKTQADNLGTKLDSITSTERNATIGLETTGEDQIQQDAAALAESITNNTDATLSLSTIGIEEAKLDAETLKQSFQSLDENAPEITPEVNTENFDAVDEAVTNLDEATPDVEVTATTTEPEQAEKDLDGAEWTASLKIEVDDSAADAFAKEWSGKVTRSKHIIQVVEERAAGGLIGDFKRLVSPLINQGGGQRDDVPAMLMRGEFVMKRDAVNKYGLGLMHAINQGMLPKSIIPRFAAGGVVGNGRALDQAIKRAISGLRGVKPFQHKPAAFLKDPFSAFKKGIAELKATGDVSGAQAELGQQQALITETYQTQITEARAAGLDEIAFALEEQKLALETLMADLRAMLDQIKAAYEIGMQEAEVGRQQALADARAAYDERLVAIAERAAEEREKADALQEKLINLRNGGTLRQSYNPVTGLSFKRELTNRDREKIRETQRQLAELRKGEVLKRMRREANEGLERDEALAAREHLAEARTAELEGVADARKEGAEAVKEARETVFDTKKTALEAERTAVFDIRGMLLDMRKELYELQQQFTKTDISGFSQFLHSGGPVAWAEGARRGVDSVRAMLTPGEYVIREPVVRSLGQRFFDALNRGLVPLGFAEGGAVPGGAGLGLAPAIAEAGVGHSVTVNLGGETARLRGSEREVMTLIRALKKAEKRL